MHACLHVETCYIIQYTSGDKQPVAAQPRNTGRGEEEEETSCACEINS